ncbi:hypothetical protein EDC04DRAFT_2908793 [Pisolithus marmoratus]|nr:hypothetical protein EDC04DRAFT_2908793 [Pisolithus marmoratus]
MSSSIFDHPILQDVLPLLHGNKDMVSSITMSVMSGKYHHHHSSSTSSDSTPLPPQKKIVVTFSSPNHDQIKEALQSGGACEFDVKTVFLQKIIHIDFYAILMCDLDDLVDKKVAFNIKDVGLSSSTMQLDLVTSVLIRVRAFKTVQMAQLTHLSLRVSGIGLSANDSIVLKRPYIDDHPNEVRPPFTCYMLKDKCSILYHEANTLYWAKALLQMTYWFVDQCCQGCTGTTTFQGSLACALLMLD